MSIAQTVAPSKLRQERHGEEDYIHRLGRALNPKHAAPDGAWVVFRRLAFYTHGAPNGAVVKPNSAENTEESGEGRKRSQILRGYYENTMQIGTYCLWL